MRLTARITVLGLLLCMLTQLVLPLAARAQSTTPPKATAPDTALSRESLRGMSAAYVAQAWAEGLGGMVSYYGNLPSRETLETDIARMRRLLNVKRLRFYLPLGGLAANTPKLLVLQARAKRAGLATELVLSDLDTPERPALMSLLHLTSLKAISLEAPRTERGRARFLSLYKLIERPGRERGILFHQPSELAWLSQAVPAPTRWLWHYTGPVEGLHPRLRRIDALLDNQPWQLAGMAISDGEGFDEYDQAWQLRFGFYFSRKYGLEPAAVSLRDARLSGPGRYARGTVPGLLRGDESLRPGFWLAQVYYHVRRIDLDEPKLTGALYEPPQPDAHFPAKDRDFLNQFLLSLYKVRAEASVLPYLASRQSDLFYDFLQLRSEESLINSHFGRLETIDLTPSGEKPGSWQAHLRFVSSLGSFGFDQRLAVIPREGSWRVSALGEPLLRPDYETLDLNHQDTSPRLSLEIDQRLEVTTTVLRQEQERVLRFSLRNRSAGPLDLQPIALNGETDGRIYMPAPVETVLYRQLAPGETVTGTIKYPLPASDSDQGWKLRIKAQPSELYTPRALEAEAVIDADNLAITVENPLVERLLLPVLRVQINDGRSLHQLRYVLPQALLPLERKQYRIALPPGLGKGAKVSTLAGSYPIIDYEINFDDAWRSKQLGHWPQALFKYREILQRFGGNLTALRRAQLRYELIWLELRLGGLDEALNDIAALRRERGVPGRELARIYYEIAELLLEVGQPARALELTGLARRLDPQHLPLLRLQAHLLLKLNQLQPALQAWLELLARLPDDLPALETVSGIYQRLGRFDAALDPLLRLQRLRPQTQRLRTIASIYQRLQRLQPALSWYQRYYAASRDPAVLDEIAWLWRKLRQPRQALVWYRRAAAYNADPALLLELAWLERQLGEQQAALVSFGRYLNACSDCRSAIWAEAGYLAKHLGQPALAIRYYARHLQITGSAATRRTLGGLYQQSGQYALALQTLRPLAQSCRAQCRPLWLEVAFLARSQGRWNEALSWYRRLGPLSGLPRQLRYDLAFAALKAGDTSLADSLITGLLPGATARQEVLLRRELAGALRRQGKPAQALPLLEQGYARTRDAALLEDLLALALEAGQGRRIAPLITPLIAQGAPGLSPQGHYLLGRWAYGQGDYVTATERLKAAIYAGKRLQGEQYRLLAAAYRELGQSDCAIAWLERADHLIQHQTPPEIPEGCR